MRQWLPLVWLLAVVGVSGCAKHWTKPGATNAEFSRDSYECALQHSDGGEVRKNLYRACLQNHGYDRVIGGEFIGLRD
jgi:hypothetical protein